MRNVTKRILGAAAIVAMMSASAMAADRLTVKDASNNVVFNVDDTGKVFSKNGFEGTDASGNTLFFVHPTTGRISVGSNAPNAALWLKGNVSNNIQVVSFWSGTTTAGGGGGFVMAHSGNVGAGEHYARTGDRLGYMLFASGAANGTTLRNGGGISAFAEGPFSDTSMPTYFTFATAQTAGGSTRVESLRITANGNIVAGNKGGDPTAAPLSLAANDGLLHIPSMAGAATSCATMTAYNGHVPLWYDTTNNKLCTCNAGVRKCAPAAFN